MHYQTLKNNIVTLLADGAVRTSSKIISSNQIFEGASTTLVRGINKGRLPIIQWWITGVTNELVASGSITNNISGGSGMVYASDFIDSTVTLNFRIWTKKITISTAQDTIYDTMRAIQYSMRKSTGTGLEAYENVQIGELIGTSYGYYSDLKVDIRLTVN